MKIARRIALTLAATAVGLGMVAAPAPAHADSSWGYRVAATSGR